MDALLPVGGRDPSRRSIRLAGQGRGPPLRRSGRRGQGGDRRGSEGNAGQRRCALPASGRRGCAEREGQGARTGEKSGRGGPRVRRRPDRPLLCAAGGFRPGGIPFLPPGGGEIGSWERFGQGTVFGAPPILLPSVSWG